MKKFSVILLFVLVATVLLAAAPPPARLIRLEVINNSGETVIIQLNGTLYTSHYYLTVKDGEDIIFTVFTDKYKRTTWACGGVKSTGNLWMTSNVRLTFTKCNYPNWKWTVREYVDPATGLLNRAEWKTPNFGEPTMEKVNYFRYATINQKYYYGSGGIYFYLIDPATGLVLDSVHYNNVIFNGCASCAVIKTRSWKSPGLVRMLKLYSFNFPAVGTLNWTYSWGVGNDCYYRYRY